MNSLKLVNEVVKKLELKLEILENLNGYENVVFKCRHDGEERIIRITDSIHREEKQIKAETNFINHLYNKGVGVSCPILLFNENEFFTKVNIKNKYYYIVIFSFIKGHEISTLHLTEKFVESIAEELGKLHYYSKDYFLKEKIIHRPHWLNKMNSRFEHLKNGRFDVYVKKLEEILNEISKLSRDNEVFGIIHGDPWSSNYKYKDGKIIFFDFDDCAYGWYSLDIATIIFDLVMRFCDTDKKDDFILYFSKLFFKKYEQYRTVTIEEKKIISLFAKIREIALFLELQQIPTEKYYNSHKIFMKNRGQKIKDNIPFILVPQS